MSVCKIPFFFSRTDEQYQFRADASRGNDLKAYAKRPIFMTISKSLPDKCDTLDYWPSSQRDETVDFPSSNLTADPEVLILDRATET